MHFTDREQAGLMLADQLAGEWKAGSAVVIALPRGGVPVAYPIARRLDAPLDVLMVRKLGAPSNPEFALGAIAEDGKVWENAEAMALIQPKPGELEETIGAAVREMRRQTRVFRGARPPVDVRGRPVILVDDGLATGSTLLAATASLKGRGAESITVAVPVASVKGARTVAGKVDRVLALETPKTFRAVGLWYERFEQITDAEVTRLLDAALEVSAERVRRREALVATDGGELQAELTVPENCRAWVVFAHGSGSDRQSPRNLRVARFLNEEGFGTMLFDLLTENESRDRRKLFDVGLLSYRLLQAMRWLREQPEWRGLPISLFGASTGAAAALQAAAHEPNWVYTVVSRGGRPDLADDRLGAVRCPVLLVVGSEDHAVIELNVRAAERLGHAQIELVPGASHLFEEPGTFDAAMRAARRWFEEKLPKT